MADQKAGAKRTVSETVSETETVAATVTEAASVAESVTVPGPEDTTLSGTCLARYCVPITIRQPNAPRTIVLPGTPREERRRPAV